MLRLTICAFCLINSLLLIAQRTTNLKDCEDAFLKSNLLLLAEQYNIDIAKANVIQAKIWDLPVASAEINAINPQGKRVLDIGAKGQKAIAVQQLIYLGKKKINEVEFAKSNVAIAELQLEQLLRNLRFQLHQSFYNIYFDQQKIKNINTQIASIDTLAKAYAVQAAKNNVPLRDVVRLQSLIFNLKNDIVTIQKNVNDEQENISILTGFTEVITPSVEDTEINNLVNKTPVLSLEALLNIALSKNPDYLSFKKIMESNDLMLKWQRSLAIPDVTAGISYDQRGGAFTNQINFTVSMPLPLWNRNQGNIQAAELQSRKTLLQRDFKVVELKSKIENAITTWNQQYQQYHQVMDSGTENLEVVYKGILQNFQKRNVSLIEFTDFMESYNQTIILLNDMRKQVILSCENLNYIVNDKIF